MRDQSFRKNVKG